MIKTLGIFDSISIFDAAFNPHKYLSPLLPRENRSARKRGAHSDLVVSSFRGWFPSRGRVDLITTTKIATLHRDANVVSNVASTEFDLHESERGRKHTVLMQPVCTWYAPPRVTCPQANLATLDRTQPMPMDGLQNKIRLLTKTKMSKRGHFRLDPEPPQLQTPFWTRTHEREPERRKAWCSAQLARSCPSAAGIRHEAEGIEEQPPK